MGMGEMKRAEAITTVYGKGGEGMRSNHIR
jgi:hypothetical protein